jgi:hypothetical protein
VSSGLVAEGFEPSNTEGKIMDVAATTPATMLKVRTVVFKRLILRPFF